MTTFEAIKQMNFTEMVNFLDSIENDTFTDCTCSKDDCPFGVLCKEERHDEPVCGFLGHKFAVAKFLCLDYEKTKLDT